MQLTATNRQITHAYLSETWSAQKGSQNHKTLKQFTIAVSSSKVAGVDERTRHISECKHMYKTACTCL